MNPNFSIYFYVTEISYRFFYLTVSFFLCLIILLFNIQLLFLLKTYPFLKLSEKKFIVTHTMDLLDSVWILVTSTSSLLVFPFFLYQLKQFARTSWYKYQFYFSKWLFYIPLISYWISIFICYFFLLPTILDFLSQWKLKQLSFILSIEIEFRILNYINWILTFCYCFSFINYVFTIFMIKILFLIYTKKFYIIIKNYRKIFCFFNIFIFFLFSPSDFILQFFLIFITFITYEIIFFLLCYKISNFKKI